MSIWGPFRRAWLFLRIRDRRWALREMGGDHRDAPRVLRDIIRMEEELKQQRRYLS